MKKETNKIVIAMVVLIVLLTVLSFYLYSEKAKEAKRLGSMKAYSICIERGMDDIYVNAKKCSAYYMNNLVNLVTCLDGLAKPYDIKQTCLAQNGFGGNSTS